jgi:hypothetical protein
MNPATTEDHLRQMVEEVRAQALALVREGAPD